jgi:7,8-dihydropterin-6-yl-methyl-4-(beta-D-ribofuranosyl)aminobenzene 5'-phosphate synthase
MIKINVLLENNTINKKYKPKHGLSIKIECHDKNILLDVGPNNYFIKNAEKENINLSNIDYLFLSHSHIDHTGGLDNFMEINDKAKIYLMDNIENKYYTKVINIPFYVGNKVKPEYKNRIIQLNNDINIEDKIYFIKNNCNKYKKPEYNKVLYKKENGKLMRDKFEHEGILVIKDGNELVIFNSCSHNGILNIIETIKSKIPNTKIRSYVGGLHLYNPITKLHEDKKALDEITHELKKLNIKVYTGHCTGKYSMNYMKEKLGNMFKEINTGMELAV